jgi:hypothetical protein
LVQYLTSSMISLMRRAAECLEKASRDLSLRQESSLYKTSTNFPKVDDQNSTDRYRNFLPTAVLVFVAVQSESPLVFYLLFRAFSTIHFYSLLKVFSTEFVKHPAVKGAAAASRSVASSLHC